jgi:four helix bundle protein
LRAYEFSRPLLRNTETRHIGNQLIRAATSVAANNRAAGHARSRREFCSKIGTVREESDESLFWLDFIRAAKLATGQLVKDLAQEARELAAIFFSVLQNSKKATERAAACQTTRATRRRTSQ